MKSLAKVVSSLQYAQEMLEPFLASLHEQDGSELFLSVAPGLARRSYVLVQNGLRQALEQGWYAGRKGRATKLLIDVLGSLHLATHGGDWDHATRHTTKAAEQLRHALVVFGRIGAKARRAR